VSVKGPLESLSETLLCGPWNTRTYEGLGKPDIVLVREEVKDSSTVGICPDCGAWLIRTHFWADRYEFEHWVDRCLSCGYGHEFKLKVGSMPEDWFQHPHRQPSQSDPPTTIEGLLCRAANVATTGETVKEKNP
jgi:hypothetical protein